MEEINLVSLGAAGRNKTLGLTKLENIKVPVPDIHLQKGFRNLQFKINALKAAQSGQMLELEGLFPGVLEQVFRGEW